MEWEGYFYVFHIHNSTPRIGRWGGHKEWLNKGKNNTKTLPQEFSIALTRLDGQTEPIVITNELQMQMKLALHKLSEALT